ncbi:MAG TPA: hypothetical protein VHI13_02670 [Candidatus Kapabacteria bacterium]|nr:hypothetical protein [Candidatus Kapabacteria bacterium]
MEITHERLRLSNTQLLLYAAPAFLFLLFMTALGCIQLVWAGGNAVAIIFAPAWPAFGILSGYSRVRELRYYVIRTTNPAAKNMLAVRRVARVYGWPAGDAETDVLRFTTNLEFEGSGELVTVRFDGSDVYVNSVPNPHRWNMFGPTVYRAHNRTNRTIIENAVLEAARGKRIPGSPAAT